MNIYVKNVSKNPLPEYKSLMASGMDLHAMLTEDIMLSPGESALIPTGISVVIDNDEFEFQVRPRSGLAYKNQITVLNSPGTIDADYRDDIGVILINHGRKAFRIANGDRIAQLVLCPVVRVRWTEVDSFNHISDIDRGGGLGSTGV